MNQNILDLIKSKYGVEAKFHYENEDCQCYYYNDEKGHSEWDMNGELIYSDVF